MGLFDKFFGSAGLDARAPRFDGELYPADAHALEARLGELLDATQCEPSERLRALIVPHAPLEIAGPIMAEAYAAAAARRASVDRVVVVGSSRLVPFRGLALDQWEGFETPLGVLRYPSADSWEDPPEGVPMRRMAAAFDPEESVEAQLPFVRHVFGDIETVPLLVGDASSTEVADAFGWLADEQTLLIVSANLSHDVPLERARELDEQTTTSIIESRPERIQREHSTGRVALRGLLEWAADHGWVARCLARSNSCEQGGDPAGVVGYGAFCFEIAAAG